MPKVTNYMLQNRIKQLEQEKEQLFQRIDDIAEERNKLKEEIEQLKAKPPKSEPEAENKAVPVKAELITDIDADLQRDLDTIREALMQMPPKQRPKFMLLVKSMAKATSGNPGEALMTLMASLNLYGGF